MASVPSQNDSNMYNMIQAMNGIKDAVVRMEHEMTDIRSTMMSPISVSVDDFNLDTQSRSNLNGMLSVTPSNNIAILSRADQQFFTNLMKAQDAQLKMLVDISNKMYRTADDISDVVVDISEDVEDVRTGQGNLSASSISSLAASLASTLSGLLLKSVNQASTFAFNHIEKMISARNDIMYEYGLTDPKKADELYKLQFEHKAMPYQYRSAPEWRDFRRTQQSTAIDLGYNTEKSVTAVTDQLYKWQNIFEDINFSSSNLFKNTMRFVDKSGKTFNEIMTTVQEASTNYIVTPTLLEEVASSYSKYLRVVTKSNTAFSKSMTNLVNTVAKLEDAGVSAQGFYEEVQNFQYSSLSNAASSDMWTRLAVMGIDPNAALRMDQADLTKAYTEGLQNYFSQYDLRNANDRQMVNLIAQEQLGFSVSQMQDLYDLLLANESGSGGSDSSETDYQKQLELKEQKYYDEATRGWTYLTESQKFQDAMALKVLNNDGLVNVYEKWDETTKGLVDINNVVDTISTFLIGGGLLNLLKGVFGGGGSGGFLSSLFGSGAGSAVAGEITGPVAASAPLYGIHAGTKLGVAAGLGMTAGGIALGGYDAYRNVSNYNELLGDQASLNGKIASGIGGFFGGTGKGWGSDESFTTKFLNTAEGAAKGALIGSFAGPVGTVVGGVIGAGFAAVGGETISELFMDQNTLADKRQKEALRAQDALVKSNIDMTNQLIASQDVQYHSAEDIKEALGSNSTALTENQESIKTSLESYGLSQSAITEISNLYSSNGDLKGALDQVYPELGADSALVTRIQAEIDAGKDLSSILGGVGSTTNDNLKTVLSLLNENAAQLVVNTGASLGTYQDEYGRTHAAIQYESNSNMASILQSSAIGNYVNSTSNWTPLSESALQYASELATQYQDMGVLGTEGYTEQDIAQQVLQGMFTDTTSSYFAPTQALLAQDTSNTYAVGFPYTSLGMQIDYGNVGFAHDEDGNFKYWNNNKEIPYVTEDLYNRYISRHAINNANSTKPVATNAEDIENAVHVFPVDGDSDKFVILFDDNTLQSYEYGTMFGTNIAYRITDTGAAVRYKPSPHKAGLANVPYDNYLASLHKGERVLTANENFLYKNGMNAGLSKDILETDQALVNNQEELNTSLNRTNQNGVLFNMIKLKDNTSDNTDEIKKNTSTLTDIYKMFKDQFDNATGGILGSLLGGSSSSGLSGNSLVSAAGNLISMFEGSATSINGNDNGALSIGKMQWHGDNAKSLLQNIYNADPTAFTNLANQYGASGLVSSVTGGGSWSHKVLSSNSPEYQAIQAILGSSSGQSVQDQMQSSFVQSYIDKGRSLGLTDSGALLYFADFANQYGTNSSLLKQITLEAIQNGGTLDAMYAATQAHNPQYMSRRTTAYNRIKGMDLSVVEGDQSTAGTAARRSIINFVKSKLGLPYVWGASGPNAFDCSGLVSAAAGSAGILSGRLTTAAMSNNVQRINSEGELIPGDIVMGNWSSSKGRFQHTGIYIGNNTIIHASGSQSNPDKVKTSSWSSFWGGKYVGLGAYARGGVIESPTLSLLGEGGYNEYVIPTDPKYKNQSTALLSQAASDVGVATLSTSADTGANKITEVYVDTDSIIEAVEELSKIVEKGFKMFERASTTQQESQSTSNSILSYT